MTDGQYWINVGSETLFEYSEPARVRLGAPRYCNYQVVRLHEDLLAMVSHVIEPVPAELTRYIAGDRGRAWSEKASAWYAAKADREDDRYWQIIDSAGIWVGNRTLDSAYLSPSASIRIWSDESLVHIEWDNRSKLVDGVPAWSALCGSHSLPRDEFVREVKSFHTRLMEEMGERVKQVVAGALPPEVRVDLPNLQREHEKRRLLWEGMFAGPATPTDWKATYEALLEIEQGNEPGV